MMRRWWLSLLLLGWLSAPAWAEQINTSPSGGGGGSSYSNCVGDAGAGGTAGLVPAPGAGDAAAGKFLKADCTFAVPSGATSVVRSIYWGAGAMNADGTFCLDPTQITINSGPKIWKVTCADNDGSSLDGSITMPDGWDGGTVTFELSYIQTAADTAVMNSDIAAQCHGPGEVVNSTWGTEIAIDDPDVTGSNAIDHTTSAAVTPAGTCNPGDSLFWRWQLDATGTTTAVGTLHIIGMKMEYTITSAD